MSYGKIGSHLSNNTGHWHPRICIIKMASF